VSELNKNGLIKFAALGWMGLLKDLARQRPEALGFYREALKCDTGESMDYRSLRILMDRKWIEERLKEPFTLEATIKIPSQPTPEQLVKLVQGLNWTAEGKTPFLVYRRAKDLGIGDPDFWLKLGLLLFDSGYYTESYISLEKILGLNSPELDKFTALTWMGHLLDLQGQRAKAVEHYRKALEHDSGGAMEHGQYRIIINRQWVEDRIKTPFVWKKRPA
jgi:tetratricopeptide (TPR) repeat protein